MSRFKEWLYQRFLPAWCRDDLLETNARLRERIEAQDREIQRLSAYIDGMERAMRHKSRIIINAEGVTK